MREDRTAQEVFENIPEGKGTGGKPRTRWLDDVKNYMKKVGVRSWRKQGQRCLEIDPEGCQGPSWTVRPVVKESQGGWGFSLSSSEYRGSIIQNSADISVTFIG